MLAIVALVANLATAAPTLTVEARAPRHYVRRKARKAAPPPKPSPAPQPDPPPAQVVEDPAPPTEPTDFATRWDAVPMPVEKSDRLDIQERDALRQMGVNPDDD